MYKKRYGVIFSLMLFTLVIAFEFNLKSGLSKASPEISAYSLSPLGNKFGKVVAASCAYGVHGGSDEFSSCSPAYCGSIPFSVPGTSQCGGVCQPNDPNVCNSTCPTGLQPSVTYSGHQVILNGIYYYTHATGRPAPNYTLGSCGATLPSNIQRIVEVVRVSSDGTNTGSWTENYDTNKTTWTGQAAKTYPYNEYLKIRASYFNTTTGNYISYGPWVQADASTLHPNYGLPCTNTDSCNVVSNGTFDVNGVCTAPIVTYANCARINLCGQSFSGIACPNECRTATTFTNYSCIKNFSPSTDQVNPNGSVEFSWELVNSTNTPRCSFVDLTYPTPRQIPGLQNLDPTIDRTRITNIQTSTRFCLVCQFYNGLTGALLGETAKHQWVRVQRIGEN